ncbi:MAG: hypothetical protein WCA77_10025 [Thermoplasmata archaeon]
MHRRWPSLRVPWGVAIGAVGFLLVLSALPGVATAAPVRTSSLFSGLPSNGTNVIDARFTFNGIGVTHASTPANAISAVWETPFNATYTWPANGSAAPVGVQSAVLQIWYFGAVIASRSEALTGSAQTSGTIHLTSDYSQNRYLIEGLFALKADLDSSNGSILWSQSFYIHITEVYDLVITNVGLVALLLYEIYAIVTAGRSERPRPPKSGAPDAPSVPAAETPVVTDSGPPPLPIPPEGNP